MRKTLETIFSPFGEIEAIEMWKNIRMRGQAFIVYKDPESSQRALEKTPNFLLYGKPLVGSGSRVMIAAHSSVLHPGGQGSENEVRCHGQERWLTRREQTGPRGDAGREGYLPRNGGPHP